MTTVDLVVKGGRIYSSTGSITSDIVVDEGKIIAISNDATLQQADRIIDATGKLIFPGLVDTHCHFRDPGFTHKEDWETGSRAAAFGGVTFAIDMPNTTPPPNTVARFIEHQENANKKSLIDFNHWAMPTIREEIPKIAEAGAVGFKFFMKSAHYPYGSEFAIVDHAAMLETFREIAKTGRPCAVHPHNQMIWEQRLERLKAEKRVDHEAFDEATYSDDAIMETSAIAPLILLANSEGCKLRVLHVYNVHNLKLVRALRNAGYNFTTEMNPWAVFPMRTGIGWTNERFSSENMESDWEALNDGTIDVIGCDHAPNTRDEVEKAKANVFNSVITVLTSVEFYLAMFLSEFHRGKITLEKLVELWCENPAKHIGLFPKKGILQTGADADFTIIDLNHEWTIRADDMVSKCKATVYDGRKVKGAPTHTVVRGNLVVDNREVVGKPGYGEFTRPL